MDSYQQEELMEKSFDATLMKRLMGFARPYWHWIALSILLLLFITIGELLNPYLIRRIQFIYIKPNPLGPNPIHLDQIQMQSN